MVRGSKKIPVDKSRVTNYKVVAENFFSGADVAAEYEYWNAAGVLIVHSAIALGDSITIKYGGVKSKGEDHHELVNLIDSLVVETDEKKSALIQLSKIIAHKNSVSYSGDIYIQKDITKLWKHLKRFKSWAEKILS